MKGTIKAICTSPAKGTVKRPVDKAVFIKDFGIEGDAHAGNWHRQVSLLSYDKVVEFNKLGGQVEDGDFGENLLVTDIDFKSLPIGTIFLIGDVKLRLTQIGKECHSHCEIYKRVGTCIMPHEGVFAEVLEGGTVFPGDTLEVVDFKE
ncbi:MAG: MOSC domain-containing protein [Clostridiales bacterium]|nr:MOSC domain-containing protein [Clostridiales bacterium]